MAFIIKYDSIDVNGLYDHFVECNTFIEGVDLHCHSRKLREYATTIEAWYEDELVGLCACYMNDFESRIAYISHIEMRPEFKSMGYGKKIMESTIALSKAKGFEKIQLEVDKENFVAIAFYNKFGFDIAEDRGRKLLMAKDICKD